MTADRRVGPVERRGQYPPCVQAAMRREAARARAARGSGPFDQASFTALLIVWFLVSVVVAALISAHWPALAEWGGDMLAGGGLFFAGALPLVVWQVRADRRWR